MNIKLLDTCTADQIFSNSTCSLLYVYTTCNTVTSQLAVTTQYSVNMDTARTYQSFDFCVFTTYNSTNNSVYIVTTQHTNTYTHTHTDTYLYISKLLLSIVFYPLFIYCISIAFHTFFILTVYLYHHV